MDRGTHRPAIEPRNGVNRGADVVMTGEGNIAGGVMRESLADPARSENLCMCGLFMRENREIPRLPSHRERCGPLGEG